MKKFSDEVQEQIDQILSEELSCNEIVEVRKDPKVSSTYAFRVKDGGCALIQIYDGECECLDTFELEEGQTSLKDLKSGSLKFL